MNLSSPLISGAAGLLLGVAIGAIAQVTTFCSVGAVADIVLAKDWRRMRSWLIAAATALIGTQVLSALGWADLSGTPYGLQPSAWPAVVLGSVAFGFGMAQAGGCVQRALIRAGSGSTKSLVTLAIAALTAAATLRLMPAKEAIAVTLPHPMALALSATVGGALLVFCLWDGWFRKSPGLLWGGVGIGAAVAIAWTVVDSHRGFNLLLDLGTLAGQPLGNPSRVPIFGLGGLVGIALGAMIAAGVRGDLYRDRFVDADDVRRHVVGGILMGAGGALALGCSFGQGLAGFSTLSASAVIAMAGMAAGCLWGIRALEAGTALGGLRLVFRPR